MYFYLGKVAKIPYFRLGKVAYRFTVFIDNSIDKNKL